MPGFINATAQNEFLALLADEPSTAKQALNIVSCGPDTPRVLLHSPVLRAQALQSAANFANEREVHLETPGARLGVGPLECRRAFIARAASLLVRRSRPAACSLH
jgi:hypothetical protein